MLLKLQVSELGVNAYVPPRVFASHPFTRLCGLASTQLPSYQFLYCTFPFQATWGRVVGPPPPFHSTCLPHAIIRFPKGTDKIADHSPNNFSRSLEFSSTSSFFSCFNFFVLSFSGLPFVKGWFHPVRLQKLRSLLKRSTSFFSFLSVLSSQSDSCDHIVSD